MWTRPPTRSITASCNPRWNGAKGRWHRSRSRSWPMATTPITRRCKRRQWAAWTSMDRGKRAGSGANTMRVSLRCQTGLLYLSCRKDPHSSRSAESWPRRTYARVPRAKGGMSQLPVARPVRSTGRAARVEAIHHAPRRTSDYDGVQGEDGDRRGTTDLRETLADRGVPACLDQRALRLTAVPVSEPPEGSHGSHLGVPQLQPDQVVQHTAQSQSENSVRLGR